MRFDNIRDMFTNTVVKDGEKYLTVDVARYGRDKAILNFWEGLESIRREHYTEQGTDKTIQLIRDAAVSERIPYATQRTGGEIPFFGRIPLRRYESVRLAERRLRGGGRNAAVCQLRSRICLSSHRSPY